MLALALCIPHAARAQQDGGLDLLRRLEAKYSQIQTIRGAFSQSRVDPTFDERIDSAAVFYIKRPDKFRVDYQPPRQSTNLIADGYSYRYVPELRQVERYRFQGRETAQDLNFLLLGFGAKVDDVTRIYTVERHTKSVRAGRVAIKLTPRNKAEANFNFVVIQFTGADDPVPAEFSLEQLDGTITTAILDLNNLNIGAQISDSTFRPDWPRNVQVIDFQ